MQAFDVADNYKPFHLKTWIKEHKVLTGVIVAAFVVLLIGIVILALFLSLSKLQDIKQVDNNQMELYSVCGKTNRYRLKTRLNNPCTISAKAKKMDVSIQSPDGVVLITTSVPPLSLTYGTIDIDVESELTFENEDAMVPYLQAYFDSIPQTLTMLLDVEVEALGMTFKRQLKDELKLGPDDTEDSGSGWSLTTVYLNDTNDDNQTDYLVVMLSLSYNSTSSQMIVHLPNLSFDIYYNNTNVANATSGASVIEYGYNDVNAQVYVYANETATIKMMEATINKEDAVAVMHGSKVYNQDCALQRMLRNINITVRMNSTTSSSSSSSTKSYKKANTIPKKTSDLSSLAKISEISIDNITTNSIDMSIIFGLNDMPRMFGKLSYLSMKIYDDNGNELMWVQFNVTFVGNNHSMACNVFVLSAPLLGSLLSNLTKENVSVSFTLGGSMNPSRPRVMNRVMSQMKRFKMESSDSSSSSSKLLTIKQLKALGSDPNDGLRDFQVLLSFIIGYSIPVKGTIPTVSLDIFTKYGKCIVLSTLPLYMKINNTITDHHYDLQMKFVLLDKTNLQNTVTDLFDGENATLTIKGTNIALGNVLQNVLVYFSMTVDIDFSQGSSGSSTVKGGVMPEVNMTLASSTYDTLSINVTTDFDMPMDFPLYLGQVFGYAAYTGSRIVDFSLLNRNGLFPGSNLIAALVTLTAQYSRTNMQKFVSTYLFGGSASLTLYITLNDTWFIGPTNLDYTFTLPTRAGGNDTDVIKCVEMTNMDFSVIDIILNKCDLKVTVDAWLHNPLPFSMTVDSMEFDVYFQDPDGVLCGGPFGCMYNPVASFYFAHVLEPSSSHTSTNPLPLALVPDYTGKTTMLFEGLGNELCIRLYDQYSNNRLVLDTKNGIANIHISNFYIAISFSMTNYKMDTTDTTPCIDKLGLR